jgi:hypothetical protein
VRLPLADLLIGVTALELGYTVATGNLRHFQRIPGLAVMQLWYLSLESPKSLLCACLADYNRR